MNAKSWAQLGLVAFLLAAAGMMLFRGGDGRRINFNPYQALGAVAAEEVSGALGGQGRILLVTTASGPDPDPVMDSQIEAFRASLKRAGRVEIAATVPVAMNPFLSMQTGGAMPSDAFMAMVEKHPDVAGGILFLGFPALSEAEISAVKARGKSWMVVSAPLPGYDVMLREGILKFAIVSRTVPADASVAPGKTTREIFDQDYLILRAEEAAAK